MKEILIVVAAPGERARIASVDNNLDAFQHLVGGNLELVWHQALQRSIDPGLYLYVNEDGKRLGLQRNLSIIGDVVLGPIVVSRCNADGEDVGLDETLARRVACWLDLARNLARPGTAIDQP